MNFPKFPLIVLTSILISPSVRSSDTNNVFIATPEWKEIREGQKVPGGLHYRINLETGKKEAKLLSQEETNKETRAVLSEANESIEDVKPLDEMTVAKIRAKLKKMEFNRDVEHIKALIGHFENSTVDDQRIILDELDYYLHQIDNANDFVFLSGLSKVVKPALSSDNEDLVEAGAILLGSAAQSNVNVQNSAQKAGLLKDVLQLFNKWSDKNDKLIGRLVFALSSLVRGNEANQQIFNDNGGQTILLKLLHAINDNDTKLVVKILLFVADVLRSSDKIMFKRDFCPHLIRQSLLVKGDLDHVEKLVDCLVQFEKICGNEMLQNRQLVQWLLKVKDIIIANQETESDFEQTLTGIQQLFVFLNFTKSEL